MEKNSNYELLYIVHPDLESSIDKITDQIKTSIEGRGGKINYEENWGKRKLTYPIRKSEVGIYILNYFEAPSVSLSKLERDLRLTEEIMRFMIVSLKPELKKAKEGAKKVEKKEAVKAEVEKPAKKETKKAAKEDEEARLKKIDEKLDKLLGDEEAAPKDSSRAESREVEKKAPRQTKAKKDKGTEKE